MATTAADVLVKGLLDWGVDTVLRNPRRWDQRHRGGAAAAPRGNPVHSGAARGIRCIHGLRLREVHRPAGSCLATSGPGGIHLLNGLYDAKLDGAPVLALTGLQYHDLIHTFTQQDVELDKLFMDVCGYNARVMGAAHVENALNRACRATLSGRGAPSSDHAGRLAVAPTKIRYPFGTKCAGACIDGCAAVLLSRHGRRSLGGRINSECWQEDLHPRRDGVP